jgi:hypothetical protein
MGHIATQNLGTLLDHFADVIEGGNSYNSGSSYNGIPGRDSNDPGLRTGSDGSVTASGDGSTILLPYSSGTWAADRWEKSNTPGFFAVCTSATNIANIGAGRRITAWDLTNTRFTVDAFPAAIKSADVFTILQGFKRLPDDIDIEADAENHSGSDRMFRLSVPNEGEEIDFYGKGLATFKTELHLRLRLLKYDRDRSARQAMWSNLAILRAALTAPAHRSVDLLRHLAPSGSTDITEDRTKIVGLMRFTIAYRIDTTME